MLQLPEQIGQEVITLLVKAIHPSFTQETVNLTIKDLQNLKPVEKSKTEELEKKSVEVEQLKKEVDKLQKQLVKLKGK